MLKNKRILVAGAAGLLGREIVRSIVQEGGQVVASDICDEALSFLEQHLSVHTSGCIKIDITNRGSIQEALDHCIHIMGGLDGAVNAAYPRNKNYSRNVFEVTYEDFTENIGMHLGGYFIFMQQCAENIKENGGAFSLVNLSSIYGVIAPKFDVYEETKMTMPVEYAAIKSSLLHLNRYFTNYMKGTAFRVNSVSPGGIFNNQDERFLQKYKSHCATKGMLEASDVVGSINFLLSDQSNYMKGQNIIVDDGYSI